MTRLIAVFTAITMLRNLLRGTDPSSRRGPKSEDAPLTLIMDQHDRKRVVYTDTKAVRATNTKYANQSPSLVTPH